MKALIIDPALHSMGGHHYNTVLRLQAELGKLGVEAPCLGSAYADRRVADDLDCLAVFTHSVYGRSSADPEDFANATGRTARELSQALRWLGRKPDLVILPCCDQVLARAVAQQFQQGLLPGHAHLLIWFLYGPHPLKAPDDPSVAGLVAECRESVAALTAAVKDRQRIRTYCETPALADFYRGLGLDVGVLPGPGLMPDARVEDASPDRPSSDRPSSDRPPIVSCVGFANRPKGYHLLPDALRRALAHDPAPRFRIHGILAESAAKADQPIFDRLAGLGERVSVRQDALSPQEYLSWLSQTDLLLLPYDPDVYGVRGSGVFSDARTLGVPVVATRGCAFAQQAFAEGWGVAIDDYSPPGLARAIAEALDDLDGLRTRARLAARQARDDLGRLLRSTLEALGARPAFPNLQNIQESR